MNKWILSMERVFVFSFNLLQRVSVWLAVSFVLAPMLLMALAAFNDADYFSFPPEELSWRWFLEMADNSEYRESVVTSFKLAWVSTLMASALAVPMAIGLYKKESKGIMTFVLSPLFFPLVIWSLGLLQLYGMFGVTGSFFSLVLAHTVMITPFVFRIVLQSLRELNARLEEAAYSLGAGVWTTFCRITLPLILPGICVGAVFGFLISFTDVTLTMFISNSGLTTFPVRVYSEQRSEGLNPIVLAWSAVMMFAIFVLSLIGEKFARWSRYF